MFSAKVNLLIVHYIKVLRFASFKRLNNCGAVGVKIDGFVLDEQKCVQCHLCKYKICGEASAHLSSLVPSFSGFCLCSDIYLRL